MQNAAIKMFKEGDEIPLQDWMDNLDLKNREKAITRIELLEEFSYELPRPYADILRDGIHELRWKDTKFNYRILYGFYGKNMVMLSHGCTKTKKVPDKEIDLAAKRLSKVKKNPDKYLCDF